LWHDIRHPEATADSPHPVLSNLFVAIVGRKQMPLSTYLLTLRHRGHSGMGHF
jgi:hypothetical protein